MNPLWFMIYPLSLIRRWDELTVGLILCALEATPELCLRAVVALIGPNR